MPRRFTHLDPGHRPHGPWATLRWGIFDPLFGLRRRQAPGPPAPRVEPDLTSIRTGAGEPQVTWIGHASFLGALGGACFLIDPVFSPRRIGWVYRRHLPPGLRPKDLPPLEAWMVTHNHYDHLDAAASGALAKDLPVVVPLGLGRWFRRRGHTRVLELGWWERADVGRLRITLVPARHWSRRRILDTNRSLWGGYVVEGGGVALYHAGDTGWFGGFTEIRRRFPDLRAALLPIGGYSPAWFMEPNHLTPEQAGRAFLELGARWLVPMHWGTFQLTDEPLIEPVRRLREWWWREVPGGGQKLAVLAVGETVVLEE